ncbi:MAG: acyl-CoA thioesterase [Salinigranum sp.]
MTELPYETELDVRWQDFDALGHVNNAVYTTYFELARLRYLEDEFDISTENVSFVVARLEVDFVAPITKMTTVSVRVGLVDVGHKSFRLAYELRWEGSVAARCETVQVTVDEDGGATPVPDSWRKRFEEALTEE